MCRVREDFVLCLPVGENVDERQQPQSVALYPLYRQIRALYLGSLLSQAQFVELYKIPISAAPCLCTDAVCWSVYQCARGIELCRLLSAGLCTSVPVALNCVVYVTSVFVVTNLFLPSDPQLLISKTRQFSALVIGILQFIFVAVATGL